MDAHSIAMSYEKEWILVESPASVIEDDKEYLGIKEVCRKYAVTARTLRFYEARNLVTPLRRGTARLYRAEDCMRIALVLKAKAFGFTLDEIARMLSARNANDPPHAMALTRQKCLEQIRWLQSKRASIDAALIELQALLQE